VVARLSDKSDIGGQLKHRKTINFVICLLSLSGCATYVSAGEGSLPPAATNENVVSVDPSQAENALRESLYNNTGYLFLTECPNSMSGVEGSVFTCFACPQDYAAPDVYGRYSYGDGSSTWRCDAAGEGFAVDYRVINGEMILENS
jgi:hypothetical protein